MGFSKLLAPHFHFLFSTFFHIFHWPISDEKTTGYSEAPLQWELSDWMWRRRPNCISGDLVHSPPDSTVMPPIQSGSTSTWHHKLDRGYSRTMDGRNWPSFGHHHSCCTTSATMHEHGMCISAFDRGTVFCQRPHCWPLDDPRTSATQHFSSTLCILTADSHESRHGPTTSWTSRAMLTKIMQCEPEEHSLRPSGLGWDTTCSMFGYWNTLELSNILRTSTSRSFWCHGADATIDNAMESPKSTQRQSRSTWHIYALIG